MPSSALFALHDHRGGVPADEALDAPLDVGTARHQRLLLGGNGVDVRRVGGERELHAVLAGVNRQLAEQPRHFRRAAALEDVVERVEPLPGFEAVQLRRFFGAMYLIR